MQKVFVNYFEMKRLINYKFFCRLMKIMLLILTGNMEEILIAILCQQFFPGFHVQGHTQSLEMITL